VSGDGVLVLTYDRFEADDVIGTLANAGARARFRRRRS
jgi:hypothetical protein